MKPVRFDGLTVFTVGHSNRTLEEFVPLLWAAGVATLVDVRRFPKSPRHPHFSSPVFGRSLQKCGVGYEWIEELGGRRRARPDTHNEGWRNKGFRGYADHMESAEFEAGLRRLVKVAQPFAIMCSEAVPWRCHRWLVSDALLVRGAQVFHLVGPGTPRRHELTAFARRRGTTVRYPSG